MSRPVRKRSRLIFGVIALMALGPLAALVIGSNVADPEPVATTDAQTISGQADRLAPYDDTKRPVAHAQGTDIVDVVRSSATYETFSAALGSTEMADTLASIGPFTVFVPTEAAFGRSAAGSAATGSESAAALREMVRSHVVEGRVSATDLMQLDELTAINGNRITLATAGDIKANDATVVATEVADNGVIHVVDTVL